jgi:hypothetical protein
MEETEGEFQVGYPGSVPSLTDMDSELPAQSDIEQWLHIVE